MQILIPVAGRSPFFKEEEYHFPKPLIDVQGRTMIERTIEPLRDEYPDARFLFVLAKDDVTRFTLDGVLRQLVGERAEMIILATPTEGALCSCLMAIDHLEPEQPLLIANSDQIIAGGVARHLRHFAQRDAAAGVITFDSVHPRWSYVRTDSAGNVLQAAEKQVISRDAIAGSYYFRTAQTFVDAAQQTILVDDRFQGRFYVAPSLNQLIIRGERVLASKIPVEDYTSFFTPQKIQEFVESNLERSYRMGSGLNVVIPAAGEGSRFVEAGWRAPKPFLDCGGQMMIERVIKNVTPSHARSLVLARRAHIEGEPERVKRLSERNCTVHPVEALTEGTACTVLLAREEIDNDQALMVANSDQLVDFDVEEFVADCVRRRLDGSILVFRDPHRDPKWSFAKLDDQGLVVQVAEKVPISDLATVGIYYFSKGSEFVRSAIDMIVRNDRVKGEFYTCPVYNYMIARGLRIGVFEVEQSSMHGLGTPDDLLQYLSEASLGPSLDAPEPR